MASSTMVVNENMEVAFPDMTLAETRELQKRFDDTLGYIESVLDRLIDDKELLAKMEKRNIDLLKTEIYLENVIACLITWSSDFQAKRGNLNNVAGVGSAELLGQALYDIESGTDSVLGSLMILSQDPEPPQAIADALACMQDLLKEQPCSAARSTLNESAEGTRKLVRALKVATTALRSENIRPITLSIPKVAVSDVKSMDTVTDPRRTSLPDSWLLQRQHSSSSESSCSSTKESLDEYMADKIMEVAKRKLIPTIVESRYKTLAKHDTSGISDTARKASPSALKLQGALQISDKGQAPEAKHSTTRNRDIGSPGPGLACPLFLYANQAKMLISQRPESYLCAQGFTSFNDLRKHLQEVHLHGNPRHQPRHSSHNDARFTKPLKAALLKTSTNPQETDSQRWHTLWKALFPNSQNHPAPYQKPDLLISALRDAKAECVSKLSAVYLKRYPSHINSTVDLFFEKKYELLQQELWTQDWNPHSHSRANDLL